VIKINLEESIRQRLKNLSLMRKRPFDEILRYYAMERFLFRLSVTPYTSNFFLKGGLILKVWNSLEHRATMDIDFLARTSNQIENLRRILIDIAAIQNKDDAIIFDTRELTLKVTQTGGDYQGVSARFSARLYTTEIPVFIDIGFNDIMLPEPREILYPTLLGMTEPKIFGYAFETVVAEKLECIVKRGLVNTRMKDFYDLWTLCRKDILNSKNLELAIRGIFSNRGSRIEYPIAFTKTFYEAPETVQRWHNFLAALGKEPIALSKIVNEISDFMQPFLQSK
jgi:predicted nucleotidyltransferase component of viral defense system